MNFFLAIIILFTAFIEASAQKKATQNGWEFLSWNMDSASVNKLVKHKRAKNELRYPNAVNACFRFQEMNTWLKYDSLNNLNKVRQKIDFSVIQLEEAKKFYEKIRTRMLKEYGIPKIEYRDTLNCNTNIYWELEYTKIHLEYDYQHKIIDEFGAGSYWVEIMFEKAE